MKRLLLMALVVGVAATAANAATLGMQWTGTDAQKITAVPSQTVSIDIILTVYATSYGQEGVSTVIYSNNPVVDDNLIQVGLTADPVGDLAAAGWNWAAGGAGGALGGATQQVALAAVLAGDVALTPGSYVIGRQFLHLQDEEPFPVENKEITFDHTTGLGVQVLNAAGAQMSFHANYATYYYGGTGFVAYDHFGNPGWTAKGVPGQPTPNPLLLGKIPEPASLALLALGGLAVLRRKH